MILLSANRTSSLSDPYINVKNSSGSKNSLNTTTVIIMTLIDVPDTCALAINNMLIVGRPIWRLTEGKHIARLEITWQLPRQPIQRRSNQRHKKKTNILPADGVTKSGVTSKMASGDDLYKLSAFYQILYHITLCDVYVILN